MGGAPFFFFVDQHADAVCTITCETTIAPGAAPAQKKYRVDNRIEPVQLDAYSLTVFLGEGDDFIISRPTVAYIEAISTAPDDVRMAGLVVTGSATVDAITSAPDDAVFDSGSEQTGQASLDAVTSAPAADLDIEIEVETITIDAQTVAPDDAIIATTLTAVAILDAVSEVPAPAADFYVGVVVDPISIDALTSAPDDVLLALNQVIEASATIDAISGALDARDYNLAVTEQVTIDAITETSTDGFIGGIPTCLTNRTSGRRTRLLIQDEDVWGEVSGNQVPYVFEITGETITNTIEWLDGRQDVASGRAPTNGLQGRHDAGGQIIGELQANGPWPMMMRHVLTSDLPNSGGSIQGNPTTNVHVLGADDAIPPGFTLEKHFIYPDGKEDYFRYPGCRVDAVTVRHQSSGPLTVTAEVVAKDEERVYAPLHDTPNVIPSEPFNSFLTRMKLSPATDDLSPEYTIVAAEFTIKNNLRRDQYTIPGGRSRTGALPRRREINGVLTMFLTDETFDHYQAGLDNVPFRFTMINFVANAPFPNWAWDFGLIEFRGTTPVVPGPGPLNVTLPFVSIPDPDEDGDGPWSNFLTVFNDDPILSTAI